MPKIPLTKGQFAIVDRADYNWLNQWKWTAHSRGYAYRIEWPTKTGILMHRLIMGTPDGMATDHINHNKLDNRRRNLRVVTYSDNCRNRKTKAAGVYFDRRSNKWTANITIMYKTVHLGTFETRRKARRARREAEAVLL